MNLPQLSPEEIAAAIAELTAERFVKICGITTLQQAREIEDLGADALGLNFWPQSKRYVDPQLTVGWEDELYTMLIGVTVNASPDELKRIIDLNVVDLLQLHGDETPEDCELLLDLNFPFIKALQVRDADSLDIIGAYPCETILLDAYCPGSYGGEGKTFPWDLAIRAQAMFPDKRFILAGGLTPQNVADAVKRVQPYGVDVASGVESAPGVKDMAKVAEFIAQARS
jgi:phosphoribosylanthranilate isomerase